jgi:hypothetical protein
MNTGNDRKGAERSAPFSIALAAQGRRDEREDDARGTGVG